MPRNPTGPKHRNLAHLGNVAPQMTVGIAPRTPILGSVCKTGSRSNPAPAVELSMLRHFEHPTKLVGCTSQTLQKLIV